MAEPKIISFNKFLRVFKDNHGSKSESRFCFIIGAGASVASGIKSGEALARKWFAEIEEDLTEEEFEFWVDETNIEKENPELNYPEIYQKRFEDNPKSGHEALMSEMSDKEPSVGYPLFAQVLVETKHNIVITTNFDSLVESSVYRYTNEQPLVIGHENLANFLDSTSTRPIIAKIHRDLLLNPKNGTEGTSSLPEEWSNPLKQILETTHIVVVGYGGNDGSLMGFLEETENRNAIYWCTLENSMNSLSDKVKNLLNKGGDRVVHIPDFDCLMIELSNIFECERLVDSEEIEKSEIVKTSIEKAKNFQKQIDDYAEKTKDKQGRSDAITKLVSDWYEYQIKVDETDDIDEKDAIYREGIEKMEHPNLVGNYANFLKDIKKDFDAAENYYLKVLELEPEDSAFIGNYALFLESIRKEYDEAEKYYLKALALDPNNTNVVGNYAVFLSDSRKNYDEAEKYYLKALAFDPNSEDKNGNYAGFLFARSDNEKAKDYLTRAWDIATGSDLILELNFYEYAHVKEKMAKAEKEIIKLLDEGVSSPGFDLSQNVEKAIEDGHPYPEKLREYANRISTIE